MAILGNNHKGGNTTPMAGGRNYCSKFTLASPAVLTELHGWFTGSGGRVQITLYADSGSVVPAALLAFTAPLTPTGPDVELSQSGFSTLLSAGTYWIGWCGENTGSSAAIYDDPGSGVNHTAKSSLATFNPPQNPYPTLDNQGTRLYSMWAVVTPVQPEPTKILTSKGWVDIGNDSAFVSGSGAPSAGVGATGAIYLDTASSRMYGPKAAGAWPATSLPGMLSAPDNTSRWRLIGGRTFVTTDAGGNAGISLGVTVAAILAIVASNGDAATYQSCIVNVFAPSSTTMFNVNIYNAAGSGSALASVGFVVNWMALVTL